MKPDDRRRESTPDELRRFRNGHVPTPAVKRLSLYLRELEAFLKQDQQTISSKKLGQTLGLTDAQVRKDLAYFGQFGHPGIGYRVDELIARIRSILGTDRTWNAILVGAGNLGRALISYRGFFKKGFRIVAVFDAAPTKIGQPVGPDDHLRIQPMEELAATVRELNVQMAILAVPAEVAQAVVDDLVALGIKGLLNFAPASINVPDGVSLDSVDLAVHFEQLAFRISAGLVAEQSQE